MMTETEGDIENPIPEAEEQTAAEGVPVPEQAPGCVTSKSAASKDVADPNKKCKALALASFLLVAVVLAITLGLTLGGNGGDTTTNLNLDPGTEELSTNIGEEPSTCLVGDIMYQEGDSIGHIGFECIDSSSYDGTVSICGPNGTIIEAGDEFTCSESVPYCVQCGPRARGAALCLSSEEIPDHCKEVDEVVEGTNSTVPTTTDGVTTTDPPPVIYKQEFLRSVGPLQSKVKIINPGVANGYVSCSSMREDFREALKHYANKLIVRESKDNTVYEKCDPNDANWSPWGNIYTGGRPNCPDCEMIAFAPTGMAEESMMDSSNARPQEASSSPTGGDSASKGKEDSFDTNNQVEGVDEADIVKSDGTYVFAAYGNLLYVWDAQDATKGTSITKMPYAKFNEADCPIHPPGKPFVLEESLAGDFAEEGVAQTSSASLGADGNIRKRHRKASMIAPGYYCGPPAPRIESLLFDKSTLTVIVSEDNWNWRGPMYNSGMQSQENEKKPDPIISDYTKLTVRVYDISDVALDGSSLKLIGEREIKGNYDSARSVGQHAFVVTTSHVNTGLFANDLYRHHSQFCGLKSTEYEALASDIALKTIDSWIDQLLGELQLQLDGSCNNMFQISAMQSGDSTEDNSSNGDMLRQFVQVQGFDMSSIKEPAFDEVTSSVVPSDIAMNVAAAFSSGWLKTVYGAQDFAATINVGNHYNAATRNWDESTFILGFSMNNGSTPKPFAFAEVPGSPLNQYSTDLYDGHLRTVTTENNWWWEFDDEGDEPDSRTTNKIFILKLPKEGESQELKRVGETGHLGKPNEEVKSVRFIKDKVYIVTYERTDPFYIYDLSVPENPVMLGELEIPGFSSYLHPITLDGTSFILGVGQETDENQRTVGLKISLFDVSEDTNPTESAVLIDKGASSSANSDFKSFRWLSKSRLLIIPNQKYDRSSWGNNFDGFVVYSIASDKIEPIYEVQHSNSYDMRYGCWYNAYMPARSFVFQSKLTTILTHTVKSTDLETGKELWNMTLGEGLADENNCGPYFWW